MYSRFTTKIIQVFLCVLCSGEVSGVVNYVPGYIVLKNHKDTIQGEIEEKNWRIYPKKVVFKSVNIPERSFNINELKAFGIDGKEHFIVHKVDLDLSPVDIRFLKKTTSLEVIKDTTIALKVLLEGNISLFHYISNGFKNHYFYSKNDEFVELIDHHYLREKNHVILAIQNKIYETQLRLLFAGCTKSLDMSGLRFDSISLMEYFVKLNKCENAQEPVERILTKETRRHVFVGVNLGMSNGTTLAHSSNGEGNNSYDFKKVFFTPSLGINSSIHSNKDLGKPLVHLELRLGGGKYLDSLNNYNFVWRSLSFATILRRPLKLNNSISPYVGAGFDVSHRFYKVKNKVGEPIYGEIPKLGVRVLTDVGVGFGKFIFSTRASFLANEKTDYFYSVKNGVINYVMQSSFQRFNSQFVLTYIF